MKKWLTQNLALKFLAVICATVLWLIVMNINDPVEEIRFSGIPVELINTEAITDEGKVYEVLDKTNVINVTVRAKRSVLGTLDKDNIRAVADLSEVSVTNMVAIKLTSNKANSLIESIDSATDFLKLSIEDVKRKQMPIEIVTVGTPADGYLTGTVSAGQTVVRVSGPESVISRIHRVQASVDVSGMTSNISTSADLVMYDVNGEVVAKDHVESNISTVDVKVSILATKTVPLVYHTAGVPEEGYETTGEITASYNELRIAGQQSVLDTISSIEIPGEVLNVNGRTDSLRVSVKAEDYLPSGVSIADDAYHGTISITVQIKPLENRYIAINGRQLSIVNVPEGYTAQLYEYSNSSTIGLRAIGAVLNSVDRDSLTGTIDLAAYFEEQEITEPEPGLYAVEAVFTMPDRVQQIQDLYVYVELTQMKEEEN